MDIHIVQHAEKSRNPGDPSITPVGREQALATVELLRSSNASQVISSPMRRARETAGIIAGKLQIPVHPDDRLRERMNWNGPESGLPANRFLEEWNKSTANRDYIPEIGDSSRIAGGRFEAVLEDFVDTTPGSALVIVAHGGVTLDLLRNLFGDERLRSQNASIIEMGVPGCAVTHLRWVTGQYELVSLASVAHLPCHLRTGHHAR